MMLTDEQVEELADLDLEVPCQIDSCDGVAKWLGKASLNCPHRNLLMCDPCAIEKSNLIGMLVVCYFNGGTCMAFGFVIGIYPWG